MIKNIWLIIKLSFKHFVIHPLRMGRLKMRMFLCSVLDKFFKMTNSRLVGTLSAKYASKMYAKTLKEHLLAKAKVN